jgi:hypothetical protein
MAKDALTPADKTKNLNGHQPQTEPYVMSLVDQVNSRSLTRVDELPSREHLEGDLWATRATIKEQILVVCNHIENDVRSNGERMPTEITARERAHWSIYHQFDDDDVEWNNSRLIDELLDRLRDYLQILGEHSPSEVGSSTDAATDAQTAGEA